jgi:hypothetical protein
MSGLRQASEQVIPIDDNRVRDFHRLCTGAALHQLQMPSDAYMCLVG